MLVVPKVTAGKILNGHSSTGRIQWLHSMILIFGNLSTGFRVLQCSMRVRWCDKRCCRCTMVLHDPSSTATGSYPRIVWFTSIKIRLWMMAMILLLVSPFFCLSKSFGFWFSAEIFINKIVELLSFDSYLYIYRYLIVMVFPWNNCSGVGAWGTKKEMYVIITLLLYSFLFTFLAKKNDEIYIVGTLIARYSKQKWMTTVTCPCLPLLSSQ